VGRNQGITEQQLLDLADFETSPAFSALERLVLRYAVAMTETPVVVSDELFAELRQHFNPQQMVELTSAIAWENYRARFDHAFGIEAEGFAEGAVCPVPVGRHHRPV
jgi:alkylhydroperoxidase family enzyme